MRDTTPPPTNPTPVELIRAWVAVNPNERSASENYGRKYWTNQFTRIGLFNAAVTFDLEVTVSAGPGIRPTKTLYRASSPDEADGIAWTDHLHAAKSYLKRRGPRAQIWTAEAEHTYGCIHWPGFDWPIPYTEWLIEPTNIHPLQQ